MSQRRHRTAPGSGAALRLPTHWSPSQALAIYEYLELQREQLWITYGPQIQRAWRNNLVSTQMPLPLDPNEPF